MCLSTSVVHVNTPFCLNGCLNAKSRARLGTEEITSEARCHGFVAALLTVMPRGRSNSEFHCPLEATGAQGPDLARANLIIHRLLRRRAVREGPFQGW